jgi:DNA-binding NarL/FixJ family response regulator
VPVRPGPQLTAQLVYAFAQAGEPATGAGQVRPLLHRAVVLHAYGQVSPGAVDQHPDGRTGGVAQRVGEAFLDDAEGDVRRRDGHAVSLSFEPAGYVQPAAGGSGHDLLDQGQVGSADLEEILRQANPPTIVVLTTFDRSEYVYRALRAGAAGFLLKDAPATRLIAAVRAAATGDSLIDPAITRRLVERFAEPAQPQGLPGELASLTDRELDVLRLLARGLANAEIAAELVVAETTVKTHVARILAKLGLRDRVQAVVLAYETGYVTRGHGG